MNIPSTSLRVCLLQPPLRENGQDPWNALHVVQEMMRTAAKAALHHNNNSNDPQEEYKEEDTTTGIDLFVVPELCPIGYSEDTFANYLPTSDDDNLRLLSRIDEEMKRIARDLQSAICYGTIGHRRQRSTSSDKIDDDDDDGVHGSHDNDDDDDDDDRNERFLTIRQVVIGKDGEEIGGYDKIRLCDYGLCSETRFFTPGLDLFAFTIKDWRFGILICADIRSPYLSQSYVKDYGVHVLLQPAAFIRDCSFRTWKSFRETRAVETGCYFLAVNYAGNDFGESSWNPPWIDDNNEPTILGTEASYITKTLDPKTLQESRTLFPFYRYALLGRRRLHPDTNP